MAWSFARVLDYLDVTVQPDRASYPARATVRLDVTVTNRDQSPYEPPDGYASRSARVHFMERHGWGLFVVTLGALFPTAGQLAIPAGRSIHVVLSLDPRDMASRTQVLHYEMPERVRTFQLFMPLGADDAEGYRNMLGANTEGVSVDDSWVR